MDIPALAVFLMWCTILNGALLLFWTGLLALNPDWVYRKQAWLFPLPKETLMTSMYAMLGLFKMLFLFFNVVPYLALLILLK